MTAEAPSGEQKSGLGALQLWSGIATMIGLASDFVRPIGPFALIIFILFALVTVGLFLGGRFAREKMPWAVRFARYSLVGAVVFGLVVVLQVATAGKEEGEPPRGFVASVVPPLATVQDAVLDVEAAPADEFEAAMRGALKTKDETERRTLARQTLRSEDPAFRQTAMDRFYRTGDVVLRRQAVISLLAGRARQSLPVTVVPAEDNDPALAKNMIGAAYYVASVDEDTGAVNGRLNNYAFPGTAGTTGVTFSAGNLGTMELVAADDFTLQGTYTDRSGAKVTVQILIN